MLKNCGHLIIENVKSIILEYVFSAGCSCFFYLEIGGNKLKNRFVWRKFVFEILVFLASRDSV